MDIDTCCRHRRYLGDYSGRWNRDRSPIFISRLELEGVCTDTCSIMALLSVANLVFGLGERPLLDGVNLTVDQGHRVGMVGVNGCGKSTLLKMIAGWGDAKPDSGVIQVARGASVGYLTQDPDLDERRTLRQEASVAFAKLDQLHRRMDELAHEMADAQGEPLEKLLKQYEQVENKIEAAGGYAVDHQIDSTLHGLGLTDEFFDVSVSDLSGGQKGRLALAKLLLKCPDILLLDEPTNHLDIAGRQWLEQYLQDYRGGVILVSHDRWMLDRVVDFIYEMEKGQLIQYPGNYQAFREQRVLHRLAQQRVYTKQQDKIRQEEGFIARYRAGQRAAQAQGRAKRLERFKQEQVIDQPAAQEEIHIQIRPSTRCGDLVVTADAVGKAYENKPLFDSLSTVIKRGDRVGIIGPNGAGKSTLVRTLLGEESPDSGRVKVGESVRVGHYRQTQEDLALDQTVVEYLRQFVPSGTEQEARDLAGAFLFSGLDQDKPLRVLSGGERSRAVLAGLIVGGHNVLVLDEPTNHLDIPSCERLEAALRKFTAEPKGYGQKTSGGGTLILITHDRMLLESLVDQLLVLDGRGHFHHIQGTYSQYLATVQSQETGAKSVAPPAVVVDRNRKASASNPKKSSPGKRLETPPGSLSKLSQSALEESIVKIEAQLAETDSCLADPEVYRDGSKVKRLQDKRHKLAQELSPLEQEWARRAEGSG